MEGLSVEPFDESTPEWVITAAKDIIAKKGADAFKVYIHVCVCVYIYIYISRFICIMYLCMYVRVCISAYEHKATIS